MDLVVVESPTKAKTMGQYLGKNFQTIASMGHIRELPSKDGSVVPEENFRMIYQYTARGNDNVKKIISLAKKSEKIYIASDPDREGEAIAQAIFEVLIENKISDSNIFRVSFHEITKNAIKEAIANPGKIDNNLVNAQQARLALDYLVGFKLSPVLWRKLPGSRSAGRVQSVALRMIVDREFEIKKFIPQEYWSIHIKTKNKDNNLIISKIFNYGSEKFTNSYPNNKKISEEIQKNVEEAGYVKVILKESKDVKKNPYPPLTTALLQQDASRKLGFSSKKTMMIAQRLYEGMEINGETKGLITYMRTDGMNISIGAISDIRDLIKEKFGKEYLPEKAIFYKTKAKNAQEAHEAIRPTDINILPEMLKNIVEKDFFNLYQLIWQRTIACQMIQAIQIRESIEFEIKCKNGKIALSNVTGSRIKFDGFLRAYNFFGRDIEKSEEDLENEEESILPEVNIGEELKIENVEKFQHFTAPPPRYSEATLIKNLEFFGIGRPSTYSSIISVLQDREYVRLEKRQFFAEFRGIVVTIFLKNFFNKYVEYDFTANLENDLDLISDGKLKKLEFLNSFWNDFSNAVRTGLTLEFTNVLEKLTDSLAPFLNNLGEICPKCQEGKMRLGLGKFGPFLCCSNYPNCKFIKNIEENSNFENGNSDQKISFIGKNNSEIILKNGKFGRYFEVIYQDQPKKNFSIPKNFKDEITQEIAEFYTNLPKNLGKHDGLDVIINVGRFGPYISYNKKFFSIKGIQMHEISLEQTLEIIENDSKKPKDSEKKSKFVKKKIFKKKSSK